MRTRSLGVLSAALFWSLVPGHPVSAEPQIFPAEDQSQAQQNRDVSECQTLAIHQTGGLIPNGSFEDDFSCDQSDSDVLQVPAAWHLTEDPADYPGTDIRVRCDDEAHSGSRHLRIRTGANMSFIELSEPIPVEAGRSYRIRSYYRMEEVNGGPKGRIYLQARYHDANGDPIEYRVCRNDFSLSCQSDADCSEVGGKCAIFPTIDQLMTGYAPTVSPAWRQYERLIRPGTYPDADTGEPVTAAFIVLRLVKNNTFDGTIALDDISVVPMNIAALGALPAGSLAYDIVPAECSADSENAGDTCSEDADCGSGVCGDATAGFEPLHFKRAFSDVEDHGCGFETTEIPNQAFSYPTSLLGQNVKSGTLVCRAEASTDYIVSVYMGGFWMNGGETEIHKIQVNNETGPRVDETRTCSGGGHKEGISCWSEDDCVCDGEEGCSDGICQETDLLQSVLFAHVEATLVDSNTVANKGYAIYDEYIWPDRYRRHELMARSDNSGELRIEVTGYISGLVLIPVFDDEEAEAGLDTLVAFEDDMRHEFVTHWANYVEPEALGIPVVSGDYSASATDSARGYVLFRRHWMEFVEFSSRPNPEDVITNPEASPLQISATPGEYEPVTFSIWPLEDMYNVTLEATDLVSDSGDTISSSAVRTWYLQQRPHRLNPPTTFTLVSGFLPDWNVRDLYTDITQRAWLNIQVPEDATAGTYRGEIRIAHAKTGNEVEGTTLALEVKVRSFQLVRPERIHVMRRSPGNWIHLPGDELQQATRAVEDLWNHGFTPEIYTWWPHRVGRDENGNLTVDWNDSDLDETLALLKPEQRGSVWLDAASIMHRGVFEGSSAGWTRNDTRSWLQAVEERFGPAGEGFDKIYLHASAEESHYFDRDHVRGEKWYAWLDFLEDVRASRAEEASPHVFSIHTFNTEAGQYDALKRNVADSDRRGVVDFPALGIFHGTADGTDGSWSPLPSEQVKMAEESNAESFLLYGMPGRIGPGFYLWKAGAKGSFNEFYSHFEGAANNDWDGRFKMDARGNATGSLSEAPGYASAVYSKSGRVIGSWYWEEMREGVDDDAYMNTLQHWIDETASDARPQVITARQEAIETLQEIKDAIDLDDLGFDPDAPRIAMNQQPSQANANAESAEGSEYSRALGACMEHRGYTVQ